MVGRAGALTCATFEWIEMIFLCRFSSSFHGMRPCNRGLAFAVLGQFLVLDSVARAAEFQTHQGILAPQSLQAVHQQDLRFAQGHNVQRDRSG